MKTNRQSKSITTRHQKEGGELEKYNAAEKRQDILLDKHTPSKLQASIKLPNETTLYETSVYLLVKRTDRRCQTKQPGRRPLHLWRSRRSRSSA